jgi:hypothetical protein
MSLITRNDKTHRLSILFSIRLQFRPWCRRPRGVSLDLFGMHKP